jgi:hypothetical protein
MSLWYGLITGIVFGIFLQKGQVLRYDKQVGALRFLDMTIFKFMLSAIVVASLGIYGLYELELIALSVKSTSLGAQLIGGSIFGIGWGLLGYCPGTAVGALGEGRIDGLWGVLGMLCGGMLYATVYPLMKTHILSLGDFGKISLPQILEINHWLVIGGMGLVTIVLFWFFERRKL